MPIVALTGTPQLLARGPGAVPLRAPDDYVLWSERNEPSVSFRGGAVFVGYGITAPEWEWDAYAGADVTGKLVFYLVNNPGLSNPAIFRGPIFTYYGRWTYKIEEAARRGAAGIILIHTTESATYPWSTVVGSTSGERVRLETAPSSLVVAGWMRDEAVGRLLRGAGLDPGKLMGDAGHKGFRAVSLPLEFDATVDKLVKAVTFHTGQVCCDATRWLIQKPIYERFVEACVARMKQVVICSRQRRCRSDWRTSCCDYGG